MRSRWLVVLLLFGLVFGSVPVAADVRGIDPSAEPEMRLEEDEVARLTALQSAVFPAIVSSISPDDTTVIVAQGMQLGFLDINHGGVTPLNEVVYNLPPLSEIVWRDSHTAVYLSLDFEDPEGKPLLVALHRESNEVSVTPIPLPGFPISLSPNASRVLVAIVEQAMLESDSAGKHPALRSPFTVKLKRSFFERPGPTRFDSHEEPLEMAPVRVILATFDLTSFELLPLLELPENTIPLFPPSWSPDGSKLAFVRTTLPFIGREGTPLSDVATQDGLGLLPPQRNPFFQGNVVDVFDLATGDVRPEALRAADGDGHVFGRVGWSTDGQTLMTQVMRPSRPAGRRYPSYLFNDRSYLRFYDSNLQVIRTLDRPEIEAPNTAMPVWASPDEVFITAPNGLSYHVYYFNRVSGEFRRVTSEAGTYYQVRPTHHTRQLIFNYSSFQRPYELYRLQWDGQALAGLTWNNAELMELNQVRADLVTFTMRNGARRTGYLVQPADAAFPPRNAKIVVWQQGGPGFTMTNEWGGYAEQPFNILPNFGIAVLVLPLQGREGFGPQFINALADGRNFGSVDIDEAAQAVQQMINRGYAARRGVGVTGCSYGGYFASQSITRHPNLYAAANSQCTLLDLFHEWQFGFTPVVSYLEGRAAPADPEEYRRDSPLYNAVRVRTPLQLFHGTHDFLPVTAARNFHDQIAAGNHRVELLVFAEEGHGLAAPTSQLTANQALIEWFHEHLQGSPGR